MVGLMRHSPRKRRETDRPDLRTPTPVFDSTQRFTSGICERLGVKLPGATPQPAPERERKTTWKEFLCRHREVIVAADFFTLEAWTRKGLTRFLVLFFIDLSSRRVQIAGVTRVGNGLWMSQVARNLSDAAEGFLIGK